MRSFAETATADLPEPNLEILSTTSESISYVQSDLQLKRIFDSDHNNKDQEEMEPELKDYGQRRVHGPMSPWPKFIENPKIKNTYTRMLNNYMPEDVFAFQDEELQCTDILRFCGLAAGQGDVSVEILASFGTLFTHVTAHQDRLICDSFVYCLTTWSELDTLRLKYNITCASPMFHQILLTGHDRYRQLSLLKWVPAAPTNGFPAGQYQILQGNKNQITGPGANEMTCMGLFKDVFAVNSCQTFFMTGEKGLVYRFDLNLSQMKYMAKTRVSQIPRVEITDTRNMLQHTITGELVPTTS